MRIPKPFQRSKTGVWYIQIRGKQVTLGKDKAKAEAKANQLLREAARAGLVTLPTSATLHDLIDDYVIWLKDNRAPSTSAVTQYLWRDLRAAFPATLKAESVKPLAIEKFVASRPGVKSPTTKHDYIGRIIGMFNWGVRYGVLSNNPLSAMPKPQRRVRQDYLPAARFQEFYDLLPNDRVRDFFVVQLESGARTMEMFKATAAEFTDGDKFVFDIEDSKGNHASRVVHLPPRAAEIVKRLAGEYPDGPLFRNTLGRPFTKDGINRYMRRFKVKMNMPGLCATVLRHSYAHWRLTQGQDALVVAKLMGHVDTRMLARRYGHLDGSQFLADKAKELTMPLATDPAPDGEQAATEGTAPIAPADGAGVSTCKGTSRKRGKGKRPHGPSDTLGQSA